jgi:hypothetical protein
MADIDPRVLARLASRRRFIGGGAAVAAAAILGPSFLAACSSDKSASGPSDVPKAPEDDGSPASLTALSINGVVSSARPTTATSETASRIRLILAARRVGRSSAGSEAAGAATASSRKRSRCLIVWALTKAT